MRIDGELSTSIRATGGLSSSSTTDAIPAFSLTATRIVTLLLAVRGTPEADVVMLAM